MSPRATCRLITLGFGQVYDYVPSKVDWMARGLPLEGTKASEPRTIDFARHDVATCEGDEPVAQVAQRVSGSTYNFALVLSEAGVVLGRLGSRALDTSGQASAQELMEAGPSTVRADANPQQLAKRLRQQRLTTALITDPDGRLLGTVHLSDLPE